MDTIAQVFGLKSVTPFASSQVPINIPNPGLFIGLELEIECLYDGYDYYLQTAGKPWNVVEDGSLRPAGRAWEFVSKPMPIAYAASELSALLTRLKVREDENYSDRTSVHVHANVQDYTQEQLATLCLVYNCLEDVLFRYVNHHMVDTDKFPYGMCRDTNIYCVPWSQCRMNSRLIEKLIFTPGEVPRNWQKYSALNLIPVQTQGTVEWRHMHGTCNIEKLNTWLAIISSIMLYAKRTPFEEVVQQLKVLNDVSAYQQFFQNVLSGQLPYSDDYRELLAEGCINAKYSLINWEPSKNAGKKMMPVKYDKHMAFLDEVEPVHNLEWRALAAQAHADIAREENAARRPREAPFIGWAPARLNNPVEFVAGGEAAPVARHAVPRPRRR